MYAEQLRALSISPSVFDRMCRWGWCDFMGRSKVWFDHQRAGHDAQFAEPRERKQVKKKFQRKSDEYEQR